MLQLRAEGCGRTLSETCVTEAAGRNAPGSVTPSARRDLRGPATSDWPPSMPPCPPSPSPTTRNTVGRATQVPRPTTLSSLLSSSGEPASKSLHLPGAKKNILGVRGIACQWGVDAGGTARPWRKPRPQDLKPRWLPRPPLAAHRGPPRRRFLCALLRWEQGGRGALSSPMSPDPGLSASPGSHDVRSSEELPRPSTNHQDGGHQVHAQAQGDSVPGGRAGGRAWTRS